MLAIHMATQTGQLLGRRHLPNMGMELKCRTDLEEGLEFANRFPKDLMKIARTPNPPVIVYAIGLGHREDVEIEYTNVPDPNNNQPIPIYYEEVVQGLFLIHAWVIYPPAQGIDRDQKCVLFAPRRATFTTRTLSRDPLQAIKQSQREVKIFSFIIDCRMRRTMVVHDHP